MTNKELATLVADALSNAAQTIYDGIADVVDEQPVQGAETATGGANATAAADVQPEVIAAAVDVVTAAEVVEEKREEINDAYAAADAAAESYEERLQKALAILKGGK